MKAISLDELDKYIRTNKITVYDIYSSSQKSPVYSSRDEQSIEETIEKAIETFDSMPSDIYRFKGKASVSASNNTWNETGVQVGTAIQSASGNTRNQNNNQRMQTFTQEDLDRHVKAAIELKDKEHQLNECKRMYEEQGKELKELKKFTVELAKDFDELLDTLNLEGIRGEKGGMAEMAKNAVTTVVEHGTKKVIDRFATLEK